VKGEVPRAEVLRISRAPW